MDKRPVIILGSGLWGNLLAYRLRQRFPRMEFKLYATGCTQSEIKSWSFRESELDLSHFVWLKPFVSYSWRGHKIQSKNLERTFLSPHMVILPGQFESLMRKSHREEKLSPGEVDLERLLTQGRFIIDTRANPHQKTKCYRHTSGAIVELEEVHRIDLPVTMDSLLKQKNLLRFLQYFPLNPHTLLIKDVRYSRESRLEIEKIEEELLYEIQKRWKIKDILHHENECLSLPSGRKAASQHGRVIGLAGLNNIVTGDQFVAAVKLVDLMVGTSFRLGELKAVIQCYRSENERIQGLSRLLVRLLLHSPHSGQRHQILEYLYRLPAPSLEKFLNGTLGPMDLMKSFLGNSPFPIVRALLLPEFGV